MTRYRLEMNKEQARTVIAALDFAMRVLLGQWREIIECCMKYEPGKMDEWCERRDEAEAVLLQARKIVMPELTGWGHSYSVYNRPETERAYNVLLAVRSCLAYHEHTEGGFTVNFREPMAIYVAEEMPTCEVVDDGTGHKTADKGAD